MRVLAAQAAATGEQDPHGEPTGTAYQLMQAQLHEHMRTLSAIQSVERKIDAKRTMLDDFDAYIVGVLEADAGGQDMVVSTVLIWCIDTGAWTRAMQLAEYAVRHDLKLPDRYQRNLATMLLDEVSEAALAGKLAGDEARLVLAQVDQLTSGHDAPDQARAKLHKAIGYAQREAGDLQGARDNFARALALHDKAGVKKDIERLDVLIKNSAGTGDDPGPG